MEISFKIKEKVTNYIVRNDLIKQGDTIIIGVSGGADSICLLFLLSEISSSLGSKIKVLHVEHGIRGEASLKDAEYVKKLCDDKGIDCRVINIDAARYARENSLTLEEAARILRYRAFEEYRLELAKKETADNETVKIAVAHHLNDQAETVIFQMLRGSGIKGMGGMSPRRDNIIRPLLCLSREEILLYLSENHIDYRTDESNKDNTYSRNYIRNDILPRLEELQPQAVTHISEMAAELRDVEAYLGRQAEPVYNRAVTVGNSNDNKEEILLNLPMLDGEEEVLIRAVLRMVVSRFIPNRKDVGRNHFDAIMSLIEKGSGKSVNLPKGVIVSRQGDELIFRRGQIKTEAKGSIYKVSIDIKTDELFTESEQINLGEDNEITVRAFMKTEGFAIPRNTYTKCFDYDKITNGLQIRNAQPGDYLVIDGDGHRKELKDYFVNEKIPSELRDEVLIVADSSHVLWVIGYRISEQAKITENTKKILEISVTGGFPWEKK